MKFNEWFWTKCDELNKDTNFAYTLSEQAWEYQQNKIHKALLALCENGKTKEYRINKAMEILK